MAIVFLLGPGWWVDEKAHPADASPMEVRRRLARISRGVFEILEKGSRSRYLTAVARLGVHPLEWETEADLEERTRLLASELRA